MEPPADAGRERPLLEARNISKFFGAITALDHVNFQLAKGEVLGVVGDNGTGKSTLMKILSGIYAPSEGEIVFDGRSVRQTEVHRSAWERSPRAIEATFDRSQIPLI